MRYWYVSGEIFETNIIYNQTFSTSDYTTTNTQYWDDESNSSYSYSGGWSMRIGDHSAGDMTVTKNVPITIPEAGYYQMSFFLKQYYNEYYYNYDNSSHWKAYYEINNGGWVEFYKSPEGLRFSDHWEFPITDYIYLNQGDDLSLKIFGDKYTGANFHFWCHVSDLKVEKVSGIENILFEENFEDTILINNRWDFNSSNSFNVELNNNGNNGDCMKIYSNNTGEGDLYSDDIYIVSDGFYYIDYYLKTETREYSCDVRNYVIVNGGSSNEFYDGESFDYSNQSARTHDWERRSAVLGNYQQGDIINLRFFADAYDITSNYDNVTFYIDDIKIIGTSMKNSVFHTLKTPLTISNSTFDIPIVVAGLNCPVDVDTSLITEGIYTANHNSPIDINYSTFSNSSEYGVKTSGNNSDVTLFNSTFDNNSDEGIYTTGANSEVSLQYSFVRDNEGAGIED